MSRFITDLHPLLQKKVDELVNLCKHNGITIGISECLRTVKEQDVLYAQGRTKPGLIVTNCKGESYSSMHQWGVAFDFYLIMDVDGDGQTKDDAFNNATHLFNKVGELGKSIGLMWGGDFSSFKDLPHFQLPDWGATASVLKKTYHSPEAFRKTWAVKTAAAEEKRENNENTQPETASKNKVAPAKAKSSSIAGKYTVDAKSGLRLRYAPLSGKIITLMNNRSTVHCYGYFTEVKEDGKLVRWYLVQYGKYTGYCSSKYLKK